MSLLLFFNYFSIMLYTVKAVLHCNIIYEGKGKGLPRQAEVAQGVSG